MDGNLAVASTYKKDCIEQGKKYFSMAVAIEQGQAK
jgi:hypothetical protein